MPDLAAVRNVAYIGERLITAPLFAKLINSGAVEGLPDSGGVLIQYALTDQGRALIRESESLVQTWLSRY